MRAPFLSVITSFFNILSFPILVKRYYVKKKKKKKKLRGDDPGTILFDKILCVRSRERFRHRSREQVTAVLTPLYAACDAGRGEQYVQNALGHKLHVRLLHAYL